MRESTACGGGSSSNGEQSSAASTSAANHANDDDVVVVVSSVSNASSRLNGGGGRDRDDGGKLEPCSSASSPSSHHHHHQQRHFRNLNLQSGLIDSPLLQALSSSPPPPMPSPSSSSSPSTTSTPLLKASLNSPPVAHNRVPTSSVATSSSGNTSTTSASNSSSSSSSSSSSAAGNGSVDLSMGGRKRRADASPPSPKQQQSSSSRHPSEMYANLIMQLRQQNQASVNIVSNGSNGNSLKAAAVAPVPVLSPSSTSAASSRKERLKCQPSFQCPVCKKRFQRHIAMNAHFQNEHIASSATGSNEEKVCKMCSHRAASIVGIRQHLFREHQIDLEKPSSFLVEPAAESAPASPLPEKPARILQPATVTLHLTSSPAPPPTQQVTPNGGVSVSKQQQHVKFRGLHDSAAVEVSSPGSRSSSASPAPAVSIEAYPVKIEQPGQPKPAANANAVPEVTVTPEDILLSEHARDLSMRRVSMTPSPPVANSNNNAPLVKKKRVSADPVASSSPQWQCQHCNIVFPNQTLYFLHRGFHSESNPWRCNGCGRACQDMFDFNTHLVSEAHG